jgi:hypothetical protein
MRLINRRPPVQSTEVQINHKVYVDDHKHVIDEVEHVADEVELDRIDLL